MGVGVCSVDDEIDIGVDAVCFEPQRRGEEGKG